MMVATCHAPRSGGVWLMAKLNDRRYYPIVCHLAGTIAAGLLGGKTKGKPGATSWDSTADDAAETAIDLALRILERVDKL